MLNFLRQRTQSEHEQIMAMLSACIDGELTAKDRQRVEGHLSQCDACTEELRTLQYTKTLLDEAPMPRVPRSFVVRRADLEAAAARAPRRILGLSPRLAYGYLRGATALVTVVFAVLVAGDLTVRLGLGRGQRGMAPAREAYVVEQEKVVEVTKVVQEALEEPVVVEGAPAVEVEKVVVEKEVEAAPTPSPATRQTLPTATPPAGEMELESVRPLAVPEAAPTQAAGIAAMPPTEIVPAAEADSADETPTPAPMPTVAPPSPTPRPLVPTATPVAGTAPARKRLRLAAIRKVEIGLGALALVLLVATLAVRRQQS
jgi:hypothetical protein